MTSRSNLRSFLTGILLTGAATAISSAVAFWGFKKAYYLAAALLPSFMTFYALLAWLLYLKETGLAALSGPKRTSIRHREAPAARDLPEDKVSGAELLDIRDENGLIRRNPLPGDEADPTDKKESANAVRALLWSSVQLAILATALYHLFGIGATY